MGKEWISLEKTGQLYMEKILVSFDVPVLFVCKDYENRKYLCLCVDESIGEYVIAELKINKLLDMINNKVTMEYTFRNCENKQLIITKYDYDNEKINFIVQDSQNVSSDMLSTVGAFLELTNDLIKEYIELLQKTNNIC